MAETISLGLHAAVVAVQGGRPLVLSVPGQAADGAVLAGLPFGPFQPGQHRTLEMGLRQWVEEQAQLQLGYVEQLYTFGDLGRFAESSKTPSHVVSVGYLALVRLKDSDEERKGLRWRDWYAHFPWEDWRDGPPAILERALIPALSEWVRNNPTSLSSTKGLNRIARFRLAFGCDLPDNGAATITSWDDERVLERYELMYEAGMLDEAVRDGSVANTRQPEDMGEPMLHDHRRILATAIARLRGKLKYRPVVFELMPEDFTLTELQQTVETLSGRRVHKQNFRRLVEKAELVEPTGKTASLTGGRPAAYFRFRREITAERPAPGLRIGGRS